MLDKKAKLRQLLATMIGLMTLAWANGAAATETCQGSYSTALLQPLPAYMVVGLDVRDRPPRAQALAERFLAGLNQAGVATGTVPNVRLHVTTYHLGDTSYQPDRGVVSNYPEFAGLQGGLQPALPALPSIGITASPRAAASPLLIVRVDATVEGSTRVAWLASVQCRMTGSDDGQFAEELGLVVGHTLGVATERRIF
jgi:hypothetical protein